MAILACLIALSVGCPRSTPQATIDLPALTSEDPEAEAEMNAAKAALAAGEMDDAKARFIHFLETRGNDPLAPIAHLGLGRIQLAEGEAAEARTHFALVADHPDEAVAEKGRFYEGVALHFLGEHQASLDALSPFVGRTVDPTETTILLQTIAAAADQLGDRVRAIEALDSLTRAPVPEEEKEAARQRIIELVDQPHTPAEIQRAADQLPHDGAAWPLVAQRALRQSYADGNMSRVHELAEALRQEGVELDEELTTMAVRADRTQDADPRTIGAILPLSGRGREVGQLALKGMMLAAGAPFQGPTSNEAPQIVFRDDGGDPARAVAAVEDLVSLHRVIAIVGPLAGPTAEAAARRAQELGVPLVALTPTAGLVDMGPMVHRMFVTPRGETDALVESARGRGATRFAVMHPESPYGTAMADAFAASVAAIGGELVARQPYDPAATAFGPTVSALRATPFDALFVADAANKIALIAPTLASAGLWSASGAGALPNDARAITLLVPSVGFSPTLPRSSGRYLQGALFSVPFWAPVATGRGREFADAFVERYGSEPDAFAAWAYDAVSLIRRAVESGGQSRNSLASRLGDTHAETAAPSGGFARTRGPLRPTRLLTLRGQSFESEPE
jgi:ABC-type branched-subunit amino acid transport system substrate-binding protein